MIDVTGDGTIMKEVLTPGHGSCFPLKGFEVILKEGLIVDYQKIPLPWERNECMRRTGVSETDPSLDLCYASMLRGEKARFILQPHRVNSPTGDRPKQHMMLEVEMLDFFAPDFRLFGASAEARIAACNRLRESANDAYRRNQPRKALEWYKSALCSWRPRTAGDEGQEVLFLNAAQCHILLNEFDEAVDMCSKAVAIKLDFRKGLHRRGILCKACMSMV
jgi:hypothetical protein